jgi:hypothetical protein
MHIMPKNKFILILSGTILLIVLFDHLFGLFVDYRLSEHKLPGDYAKIDYLMNEADEEMIILGSSIAINALIPQTIEDSLQISCFNGGCNSQNFPFFLCMTEEILKRHTPRYLVLCLRSPELAIGNNGRFNLLKPYYHKKSRSIDSFLEQENGTETLFLKSALYRYNTIGWRILLYHFSSDDELGQKGFMPHATPAFPPVLKDESRYTSFYRRLNEVHTTCFMSIIEKCKEAGVRLIVVTPPLYRKLPENGNPFELNELERLCREKNIPFLNDCQSPFFLSRPDLFYDNQHLNNKGSELYTRQFILEIGALGGIE